MATIRKQQTPWSYNKIVYCVNQISFIWYFFHGCSFYCFVTIILPKNLEIRWFKRRRCKTANNYVLWLYLKILRLLLKGAPYATSPISRIIPLVVCRLNTTGNKTAQVLYDNIGDKRYSNGHTFLRIQFTFEMELIPLFYKMHYDIWPPGLGLQCMIVVFPGHTHLFVFFWRRKRIKMHYGRYRKLQRNGVFVILIHACK